MDAHPLNMGTDLILIICNESSTAPVWGYMIREKKMHAIVETIPHNAIQRCKTEPPALGILDLHMPHSKILDLCIRLRAVCENPLLVFLPSYDENAILDLYETGINDCVVKPISPVVFYAKVKAWLRCSNTMPVPAMGEVKAGKAVLKPELGEFVRPDGSHIKLTDLEVRLLHLLMSRPGHVFDNAFIVNKVWGLYGEQDHSLIKHAVYRLRRKLGDDSRDPKWIQTWHGKGYAFISD